MHHITPFIEDALKKALSSQTELAPRHMGYQEAVLYQQGMIAAYREILNIITGKTNVN